jgi:hypothetical protein
MILVPIFIILFVAQEILMLLFYSVSINTRFNSIKNFIVIDINL